MLNWVKQFNIFCYLDNHHYTNEEGYECLLGAGVKNFIDSSSPFSEIDRFISCSKSWCFGHLSYSLKDEIYHLTDSKKALVPFPHFYFFQPQVLLLVKDDHLTIHAEEPEMVFQQINEAPGSEKRHHSPLLFQQRLPRKEYISIVEKLQQHILKGDCYEINFCQEFFAEQAIIDAASVYQSLVATSPTPFSAFYRLNNQYLLCASPERFLKRKKNRILSQPMKGTAKRNLQNAEADEQLKQSLHNDAKERAENVMVVDLVRNDLSKVCKEATVAVDELFGVYTFPQVHQMVSTISGELKKDVSFSEIIKATFPMGSMTGAPKQRVMQLIEEYEPVGRGLFSGSVGYINPEGDFDFNVVIRSILYDAFKQYLSYYTGSGITFYSNAEKEWEECLLKGEAIKKVLTETIAGA